jgi:SAM-dependent methyltransferase
MKNKQDPRAKSVAYRDAFKSTAWYYARYRPGYPKEFFDYLKECFRLKGTGRLLDLGCGTGELAIRIAQSTSLLIEKIHLRKIFARPFMRSIRKANSTKPGLLTLLLRGRNLKNIANNALQLTGNSLALTASR